MLWVLVVSIPHDHYTVANSLARIASVSWFFVTVMSPVANNGVEIAIDKNLEIDANSLR
ncbi:hypothetical protein [Nostoc sp. ChiVER01]|uniref:hypothetical protein n=1 Tax=Nostoc sp. ChiVER01 TaxID=3075382 RepID=UPI002AD4C24E|nr:hypothetical protein [Nostoc sp. ChiVER01]MDZ8227834.1 hypothetical protein [Nostoc sp. ChiVER01]